MKEPRDFPKTLLVCQTFVTMVYLVSSARIPMGGAHANCHSLLQVIGGIVYHYCGQYVASPALGSAGPLLKKVCYGLAIPGLVAGMVLYTHIPAKYGTSLSPLISLPHAKLIPLAITQSSSVSCETAVT